MKDKKPKKIIIIIIVCLRQPPQFELIERCVEFLLFEICFFPCNFFLFFQLEIILSFFLVYLLLSLLFDEKCITNHTLENKDVFM